MSRRLCLLLFCLCTFYVVHAQKPDERNFRRYTTLDGLSDNEITAVTQDDGGFIWISTYNGLTRFDGQEMQVIRQRPYRYGLFSDKLLGMCSQGKTLLVYSHYGAQLIDLLSNKYQLLSLFSGPACAVYQRNVYDVLMPDSNTYALSTSAGFYIFNHAGLITFRYDFLKNRPYPGNCTDPGYGRFMVNVGNGRILQFDYADSMHVFDCRLNRFLSCHELRQFYPHLYTLNGRKLNLRGTYSKNRLVFNDASASRMLVYEPATDSIQMQPVPAWFQKNIGWSTRWLMWTDSTAIISGGAPGLHLVHINPETGIMRFDPKTYFDGYDCNAVMLDRDRRLWVGTSAGLFKQNTRKNAIHRIALSAWSKFRGINNEINDLLVDKGNLYVGSYTFLPLIVLDAATYRFKKRISFASLSPRCNQIWHIFPYRKDTLWFATQQGLVWYNTVNGSFGRPAAPALRELEQWPISLSYKDSHGLIWLQGYWGSGITVYDPVRGTAVKYKYDSVRNRLPLKVVNFVTEDRYGNVWLAEEGLTRWNRRTRQFDTLITTYGGFNKANRKITSLSTDYLGHLLLCNEYNGVLSFNTATNEYRQISTSNGLPENAALAVKGLPNGYLWILTRNGMTAWNKSIEKGISYSYEDSLPVAHFNGALMHDARQRRVLWAYDNYLVWAPDSIRRTANKRADFYIDRIDLAGDSSLNFPAARQEFDHLHNNMTLHFSAINFNDPGNNRFAYQINNGGWMARGNDNQIHFNNLAPGMYTVRVRYFSGSSAARAIEQVITIIIQPPFWQKAWFLLLCALAATAVIYGYYRKQIYEMGRLNVLDKQLAQMEMKALQAQMNPHFIFNCLNSIKEMILHHENKEASRYLSQFSSLIRLSLEQSSYTFFPLRATIDYLQLYVKMENTRNPNFSCTFEKSGLVNEEETRLIPSFLQPVIENAIWHGRPDKKQHLEIKVRFFDHNSMLVCEVDDNGIGIRQSEAERRQSATAHQSVGIGNIRNRIRLLNEKYNLDVQMLIADKSAIPGASGSGTRVTIMFPL